MRIAIFVSALDLGGAQKQAVMDANMLCEDHDIFLLHYEDGPLSQLVDDPVKQVELKKADYLTNARKLARFAKEHKIELIHSSLFAPMIVSALSTFFFKTSVIWHFHSHEYEIPLKSRLAYKYLGRLALIKKILFVNHELKDFFLHRFGYRESKLEVLFNSSQFPIIETKKHQEQTLHVGFAGRLVPLKRTPFLVEIAKSWISKGFEDFKFHILGDGPERENLEQLITAAQLQERFVLHGFQPDLNSYYDTFDLFIIPSREECLSLALIDAGMKSIPSLAFDVGGNNEIIVNNQTGFIVDDLSELIEKSFLLAMDKELRAKFGKRAAIHCESTFSESTHLKALTNTYVSVLEGAQV